MVLAVCSVAPVAWSLLAQPPEGVLRNSGFVQGPIDWEPMSVIDAIELALAAVISSAIIGGLLGGLVWQWRRFAGAAAALASAWATGIVALPLLASLLGIHLRTGIVCITGCESLLRDDQPFAGPIAYLEFLAGTFFFLASLFVPAMLLLVAVTVLPAWLRGRPAVRPRPRLIPSVVIFAVAYGMGTLWTGGSGFPAGLIPYLSLSIGVVAWTIWMRRSGPSGASVPGDINER